MMMQRMVGKQAPNFELYAVKPKKEIEKISLEEYKKEERWVILFFYPLDFSPICSTEMIAISERYAEFEELDSIVVGVSTDSIYAHEVWINTPRTENGIGKVAFPLGADTNHAVSKQYGVLIEEAGVALRGVFIIHPNGQVQHQAIFHQNVGRDVDEILRVLQALQSGEKCPANWKPSEEIL